MPCRDGCEDDYPRVSHGMEFEDFEATLCGVFTVIEASSVKGLEVFLERINWKEVGVARNTVEFWWTRHKKEDEARRKYEAEVKRKDDLRKSALSKLTDEEKAVLGLSK